MSAIYKKFLQALANGEINLATDTIVAYAIDTADYTFDQAHTVLADLTVAARVEVSPALTGKTIVDGIFDSADPVFPNVSGDTFEALVLYDSTSDNLISYHDGLSKTPTGDDITVNVNSSGWLAL